MACSGAELLNDAGSLACNAITCYTLKGATAEVFHECTRLIDTKQHPTAFLAEVWHELLASKSLNRLTPDERLVLLLEVGAARIGRLVSTKASQKECNAMLALVEQHTTVGTEVSDDVKALQACVLDVYRMLILTMSGGSSSYDIRPRVHKLAKAVATRAAAIVDQSYNPMALQACAWFSVCGIFGSHSDLPATLKTGKKACTLLLKTIAHTHQLPRLAYNGWHELRQIVPRDTLLAFVERHLRQAVASMTQESAGAMITYIVQFIDVASIEHMCCLSGQCRQHPQPPHRLALTPGIEAMLVHTKFPVWLAPIERYQLLVANGQRLMGMLHEGVPQQRRAAIIAQGTGPGLDLGAIAIMARIDELLGLHNKMMDSSQGLQPSLQSIVALGHGAQRPDLAKYMGMDRTPAEYTSEVTQACTTRAFVGWAAMVDPYFEQRGLDMTLARLVAAYMKLDKNVIQHVSDRKLLRMVGLTL